MGMPVGCVCVCVCVSWVCLLGCVCVHGYACWICVVYVCRGGVIMGMPVGVCVCIIVGMSVGVCVCLSSWVCLFGPMALFFHCSSFSSVNNFIFFVSSYPLIDFVVFFPFFPDDSLK